MSKQIPLCKLSKAVCFLLLVVFYSLAFASSCLPGATIKSLHSADTPCYLQTGLSLVSKNFFEVTKAPFDEQFCLGIRPPLFPALLASASALTTDPLDALPYLYWLVGLIVVLLAEIKIAPLTYPVLPGIGAIWALFAGQNMLEEPYCQIALSEWLASTLCLLQLVYLVSFIKTFKRKDMTIVGLCSALAILTRPDLMVYFVVELTLILILILKGQRVTTLKSLLFGTLPLFLWCTVNFIRFGSFQVSILAGHNLIGTTSLVYGPHKLPTEGDAAYLQTANEFLQNVPSDIEQLKSEQMTISRFSNRDFAWPLFHNQEKFYRAAKATGLSYLQYDKLAFALGKEAIKNDPLPFIKFAVSGVFAAEFPRIFYLPILFTLVLSLLLFKKGAPTLLLISCALIVAHSAHLLACGVFGVQFPRYRCITFSSFYFLFVISLLQLYYQKFANTAQSRSSLSI